jgi:Ca2+/Na+ antiporter
VAQPAQVAATSGAKHERLAWRSWVPWAIVVLAAVIALVAALNVWVKRQALSTDNWTNASSQLLENSQIRSALSVYLVNQLYENVNVSQELEQRLPPPVKPLAPQIALGLQQVAIRTTDSLLARPRVQQLWREANRRAHQRFIAVLDGKHSALQTDNGNVVLNLQPILQQLEQQTGIGSRLQGKLPPDAGKITIMKGNQLDTARTTVKVIRVMSYFLLFLVIALYGLAMYLSRDRRKILLGAGVSILVVGLLVLVVRRFAGNYLVDQLTTNPDAKKAVTATWAIGTELLRNVGENAVIYGIVVIFAAWIAGPSRPATWCRRVSAPTMRDHPWVVYGAVTLVLILVLLAGPTDAQRIYPLLVLFALAYVGTEWLRRQTVREFPAEPPPQQLPAA